MPSASGCMSGCNGGCVADALHMARCGTICPLIIRSSYGCHDVDHLSADRTSLTGSQIAVIALLQVDTNLPWCTSAILKTVVVIQIFRNCRIAPTMVYYLRQVRR